MNKQQDEAISIEFETAVSIPSPPFIHEERRRRLPLVDSRLAYFRSWFVPKNMCRPLLLNAALDPQPFMSLDSVAWM